MKKLKILITNYLEDALPANASWQENCFIFLNASLFVFTGLYVFLNPMNQPSLSEILLYLSLAILITLFIFKKTDFTLRWPLTLPFALFLIWAVIGLCFTFDVKNTLHDIRKHLLVYLFIFYLLVNYFNSKKKLETLSWVIILSITLFSTGAIILYYFIEGHSFNERLGLTFIEMYTGWMCLITISAIPLMVNKLYQSNTSYGRLLLTLGLMATIATTLLNQSRSALIGILVATLVMCLNNKKNIIFFVIAMLFMLSIIGIREKVANNGFVDNRSKINRLSFEIIKDYPMSGVGFGMQIYGNPSVFDLEKYNQKLPKEYQQTNIITAPHNMLLDIAVRTGIVGLLLFAYILIISLFMLWQIWEKTKTNYLRSWAVSLLACLSSFMAQALFMDANSNSRAVTFYTILAMITIVWSLAQKEQRET